MSEIETENLSDVLASNYMLASLTVRTWSGRKTDKDATAELLSQKGAASNAASVVKSLLAGNDKELRDCQAAYNRIRTWFYANSLPWSNDDSGRQQGDRIVGALQAMDFLTHFAKLQTTAEQARETFIDAYDAAVKNAANSLGAMYDESQYPHKDSLKSLFSASLDIVPMQGVHDFDRISIPGALAKGLQNRFSKRAQQHADRAIIAAQERVVDELKRMVTQLDKVVNDEPVRLHKTLISNMEVVAGLAESMGPLSPELQRAADHIKLELLSHEAKDFKDNAQLARSKSYAAGRILRELQPEESVSIETDFGPKSTDENPAEKPTPEDFDEGAFLL